MVSGTAHLTLRGPTGQWEFEPAAALQHSTHAAAGHLSLAPDDSLQWHPMETPWPLPDPTRLLALPRLPVASPHYADLLHLLQDLTSPWFEQVVTHWPRHPIPVRAQSAWSGELDLAACLSEAVAIWNGRGRAPYFRWDPAAEWGVKLVHLAGTYPHPPLATRMVRLDPAHRPFRLYILAGDNYDDVRDRPYAVRGLVHELGHVLLMWGHSQDRHHILWGSAPPLVTEPAQDELLALALWNLLPEGLPLGWYTRSTELNPEGQHGQGLPVQQRHGSQDTTTSDFPGHSPHSCR